MKFSPEHSRIVHRCALLSLVFLMLTSCAEPQSKIASLPPALPSVLYTNADIYTSNPEAPHADAMLVENDTIVFVGSVDAVPELDPGTMRYDLGGRFVMPGIIDGHTHPGLVAMLGGGEDASAEPSLPVESEEALYQFLEQYADEHPFQPLIQLLIQLGEWDVATFLPEGPNKARLDEIFTLRPVLLFDNSGHSMWANSTMLSLLGVDKDTPDVSADISYLVRDEHGELTGWIKEFAVMAQLNDFLVPEESVLEAGLLAHLNFMAGNGVTTVVDGGNFLADDDIYSVLHRIDQAGGLPVRFEGNFHVWRPDQLDIARDEVLRMRAAYASENLKFNTVKVHYDGVAEIMTAGMLEPYLTPPHGRGGILCGAPRLIELMLQLNDDGIDLHLHSVGDRATREILDAVATARSIIGKPLDIEVTISHLETVAPTDINRFRLLDVHANFTPHWFGGMVFGTAGAQNLGPERAGRSQVVGEFFEANANVTFSSDVVGGGEAHRANPFIAIEMAVTRQEYGSEDSAPVLPPASASVSIPEAIQAHTINVAHQLGLEAEIGSLAAGKQADFVVLAVSPLTTPPKFLHAMKTVATVRKGQLVSGEFSVR